MPRGEPCTCAKPKPETWRKEVYPPLFQWPYPAERSETTVCLTCRGTITPWHQVPVC
jgi:hypothetical protein